MPENTTLPTNLLHIRKKIPAHDSITTTHFYCPKCQDNLQDSRTDSKLKCDNCSASFPSCQLLKSGSYFLYFDIKAQLEAVLKNYEVSQNLYSNLNRRNEGILSDGFKEITDGEMYKGLRLTGFDFSCIFNTDGVPVFKSSKFSIWPILISIIELDFTLRKRNILTLALWFGNSKPKFNTFFKPFLRIANDLSSQCFVNWEHNNVLIRSRVIFPICVADSPARCQCQGTKQFNGAYGCS